MKLTAYFPALFILLQSCGSGEKSADNESAANNTAASATEKIAAIANSKQLFAIKAVKVVYKVENGSETGTQILYLDNYGDVAVMEFDLKSRMGNKHQTAIWQDKKTTIINHETKTVSTTPFRIKATEPPSIADTDEKTLNNIGYEKQANESIAGKSCEVWYNNKQNFKYYLWNKIPLKIVLGNTINEEAILVEEIPGIPESILKIPEGYSAK